uniref:Protein EARLY RESPONSIVE TO DEHYDRATION 15 n=1 Tax=Triticum urartu TaxID=4572 RepID=A0A8R7JXA7_TRIUA
MSAMVASSLNPEAPLFIPAAFQQVEDFSPQWWDLVKSTAWFGDHWYHQHQQLDDMADSLMALEAEDAIAVEASQPQPPAALKIGTYRPIHSPRLYMYSTVYDMSAQVKDEARLQ